MRAIAFQRGANIPMTTDTFQRLELQLRTSAETLISRPTPDSYNQLTKMFSALVRCNLVGETMDLGNDALSDICDGYQSTGAVAITDVQGEHIRLAVDSMTKALHLVPVNKLEQAVAEVEVFCASVGA
ncbi:MAG: hypothetical protein M3Y65_20675 [Pseudomonadota bacterium]|nr:hypothetical protein [Pseudomonadota bacterium]